MAGYIYCACCSDDTIGEPGDLCALCEDAECDPEYHGEGNCQRDDAYDDEDW